MENFELVEKLVNTFGVSYEKAKEALEASNWDAVDAAIYLEKEKNGTPSQNNEEFSQEKSEDRSEANRGTKGSFNIPVDDMKQAGSNILKTCWDFLSQNTFVVKKNTGEVFLDTPIWLTALLVCAFPWAVILVLIIVFLMGYRFGFSGPHLGKKSVKNTVSQVEDAAQDFVTKVKNAVSPDNCEPVETQTKEEQPEIVVESAPAEEKENKEEDTSSNEA